jgi:hypothetical protein
MYMQCALHMYMTARVILCTIQWSKVLATLSLLLLCCCYPERCCTLSAAINSCPHARNQQRRVRTPVRERCCVEQHVHAIAVEQQRSVRGAVCRTAAAAAAAVVSICGSNYHTWVAASC